MHSSQDDWNATRIQLERSLDTVVAALMKHTNSDGCTVPCNEFTVIIERCDIGVKH